MRLTGPAIMLRLEGLAVLSAACLMYGEEGYHWGKFFMLFLVPDLLMVGYLWGQSSTTLVTPRRLPSPCG
jgi:hypothetical protein